MRIAFYWYLPAKRLLVDMVNNSFFVVSSISSLCSSSGTWEHHLTFIFAKAHGSDHEWVLVEPSQTDLWQPVILETISSIIKQIKTGKTPGPNLMPADLLKTVVEQLAGLSFYLNYLKCVPLPTLMASKGRLGI